MDNHQNSTDIWNYVTKTERDGKKVSKCSLCFFELSGHLAGNAKKHLKTRHGIVLHDEGSVDSPQSCVVKSRLRELERTTDVLLNDITRLGGAERSAEFCQEKHRVHNKEATRRWRQRVRRLEQLELDVATLEKTRSNLLERMGHEGNDQGSMLTHMESSIAPGDSSTTYLSAGVINHGSIPLNCSTAAYAPFATTFEHSLPLYALEIISKIQPIVADVFAMASTNRVGIVVFNFHRCSSKCTSLNSFIASAIGLSFMDVPCTYKALQHVFSNSRPEAVVVNFFDGSGTVNPTIQASIDDRLSLSLTPVPQLLNACGHRSQVASALSSLVDLPAVAVAYERVTYVYRDTVVSHVTFNALERNLLHLIECQLAQENTGVLLTQTERFLTTRTEIKLLNLNVHQEWFVTNYVDMLMNLHLFANKKATLAHLAQQKFLPNWLQPENAYYEWCTIPDEATVMPGDNHVRPYVEHQCSMNMAAVSEGQFANVRRIIVN